MAESVIAPSPAAVRYYARKGSRLTDVDAQLVGPVLERLASENRSSAEDIVEEGTKAASPLHRYFEWDDGEAAHQHRLSQARDLGRSIEIEVVALEDDTRKRVRSFLPVKILAPVFGDGPLTNSTHYKPVQLVQETPSYAAQVVKRFERDAEALYRRNETLFDLPEFAESRFSVVMRALHDVVVWEEED